MVTLRRAKVLAVEESRPGLLRLRLTADGVERRAICYPDITGACAAGDEVLINTTATDAGLGTGGVDFVVCNLSQPEREASGPGHVMKLRYSPLQVRVQAAAEAGSPARGALEGAPRLDGCPVVACSLHSMIGPVAVLFARDAPRRRLVYLMTDGAALPLALSDTVCRLREAGLLAGTVTTGHAYGGDCEAVGLHDGLVAARHALQADAIVAAMGPGVVGTDSELGTTALEQGEIVNATLALGGRSVAAVRLSLAEARERHRGVSHHTLTALRLVARELDVVALPAIPNAVWRQHILEALTATEELPPGHRPIRRKQLAEVDVGSVGDELERHGLRPTTMGRAYADDPLYFQAAAAAGAVAARVLRGAALND